MSQFFKKNKIYFDGDVINLIEHKPYIYVVGFLVFILGV